MLREFISIILVFVSLYSTANQQRSIELDSLLNNYNNNTDSIKVKYAIRLAFYYRSENVDSSFKYSSIGLRLAKKSTSKYYLSGAYNSVGLDYNHLGKVDSAIYFINLSLKINQEIKDTVSITSNYNNLGVMYDDKGDYEKAIEYHIKSLRMNEAINNREAIALSYNNIGIIHYKLGNFDKSLEYYNKALKINEEFLDTAGIALAYNNIGIIYYFKDDVTKTLEYFKKSLEIYEKQKNKRQAALVLSNLGELYLEVGLYKNAANYLLEADKYYEELKDNHSRTGTQKLLGQVYLGWKEYNKCEKHLNLALQFADTTKNLLSKIDVYATFSNLYDTIGNYKKALLYNQLYTQYKDSLYNSEKTKSINELQTKYETEKKEQEIELLNEKSKLDKEKSAKQNLIIFTLIGGILLVLVITVLFIRQNVERKKKNEVLLVKNAEIMQQKEEIIAQRDEIESQRDFVTNQRDLILHQKKEITDSIIYAERIQKAVLPSRQNFSDFLTDYFIYFNPKDVVSGDFYWISKINEYTIFAVADCTGHGVPGAFMSMLGGSFLNEIVRKSEITQANNILDALRTNVIEALNQKGTFDDQFDGMDISICVINNKTLELEYSGANNPIYIATTVEKISSNEKIKIIAEDGNTKFLELKPDKMPIGHYVKMHKFSNIKIQLQKDDIIYLFSDGYADQFGGEKGKKFRYKRFKNILFENRNLDMPEQHNLLKSTLVDWQRDFDQIDDIAVMGVKI